MKIIFIAFFFLSAGLFCKAQSNPAIKDGVSVKRDSIGRIVDSAFYVNGIRTIHTKYHYYKSGGYTYKYDDSLADLTIYKNYDSVGVVIADGRYEKGKGYLTMQEEGKMVTTSVTTNKSREAEFAGGSAAWRIFILNNLDANVPVKKKAAAGVYQVIARFIVNKDGSLSGILAETNFGHGMEKEVLRLLKKSPNWVPATLFGVPVKAYRRQPITFVVSEE